VKILSHKEQSVSNNEEENVTTVACSMMAYGQSQVLSNHVFHILAILA
jgi:hypothetical protein